MAEIQANSDHRDRLGSWSGRPPQGESLLDVALRAIGWLASVDDSEEDTLIVAHGALIRAVIAVADQRPRVEVDRWRPRNCEFVERTLVRGAWIQLFDELRREANGANTDGAG